MNFLYEEKMIPAQVGSMSLVGIFGKAPHSFGNYFDFTYRNLRAVNMWAENLSHWVKETGNQEIKVRIYEDKFAFIVDERLPKGYITECCYTGGHRPNVHLWKHLLELNGQSWKEDCCGCENEEQFPSFSMETREEIVIQKSDLLNHFTQEKLNAQKKKDETLDEFIDRCIKHSGELKISIWYKHCDHCNKKIEQSRSRSIVKPSDFLGWTIKEEVGIAFINDKCLRSEFTIGDKL